MDFVMYLITLITLLFYLQTLDALCPKIHHLQNRQHPTQRNQKQPNQHSITKRSPIDGVEGITSPNRSPVIERDKAPTSRPDEQHTNNSYDSSIYNATTSTVINQTIRVNGDNGSTTEKYGSTKEHASDTKLNDINSLRLEYYKYKILTQLGINEAPTSTLVALVSSPAELSLNLDKSLTRNRRTSPSSISTILSATSSSDTTTIGTLSHQTGKFNKSSNNISTDHNNSSNSGFDSKTISIHQLIEEQARQDYGFYDSNHLRQKRSLDCSQVKRNENACCLESFHVNFTDIGWDKWILYPSGYDANYCRGQCDLSHARYYHSTLLSKFSSVIGLCCSPRSMAPLRLLYIDEDNKVHQKLMPDMIVKSCDCA